MRNVSLGFVYIENFKSFKGANEVVLSENAGLKYIGGINKVNPRLGANGAGKTSFFDAVVWCWTGYSIRGARAADLVTWGAKTPRVITGITINEEMYTIDRSGSPNKLMINDTPATQDEVDQLLLSRKRLLHSVIFGQSVDFFYDLNIAERGVLLDEIMNLDLWLNLSDKAKEKADACARSIAKMANDLSFEQGRRTTIETQITTVELANKYWRTQWENEIAADIKAISLEECSIMQDREKINRLQFDVQALPNLESFYAKVQNTASKVSTIKQDLGFTQQGLQANNDALAFYEGHLTCPQCQQRITDEFRFDKIRLCKHTIDKIHRHYEQVLLDENIAVNESAHLQKEYTQAYNKLSEMERAVDSLTQKIHYNQKNVDKMKADTNARIGDPNNPYTAQLVDMHVSLDATVDAINDMTHYIDEEKGEQLKNEYWKTAFKRVRLYQVKRVLARLQLETANAANSLGIGNWNISYSTEVETRSGTLKPGIHVTVTNSDNVKVVEESGGEEQRIRVAVAIGLSELIQEMAGIRFMFEVFDEPTSYLSRSGMDDLIEALHSRAHQTGKSIWIIDHNALDYTEFDEKWLVTKNIDGSHMNMEQKGLL